ncbi:SulP family inorganic anion transporter [Arenimonas caeni]|jgi:SulP family sulfate permease|uniref:SulP family inorganic anion transporter n=1 Tax=Arenimonas caeni TaxID=2058085 RepID=UPI002A360533|nr:SulP family inorganic anion transporter [Arenimonas caeni]MDY0023107.1 SulP family inorganic anion transporter [Arenimonas caeni]
MSLREFLASRFHPKLLTVLSEGYRLSDLRADSVAGLTVAIVALPLAMALAVASGADPATGLLTAIVAGFLISALGGSRVQVGGPTGAFIPVIYAIIASHGYDGLVIATLMAGAILVVAGLLKVGTLMKYLPQPLITGFTAGIAVIIFASQLKDLLGLQVEDVPADFLPKLAVLYDHIGSFNGWALGLALACVLLIVGLRRLAPSAPGFLVAVVAASAAVTVFGLPVETIGSRFGGVPSTLPAPSLPALDLARCIALLPAALTIAFLAGIESLLSAVVADGMTGRRHRSNTELIGQGIANGASALFGGLPATGAIARTATNIRAGGRTPVAGMLHAGFLLAFVLLASDLASYVPLPALAGLLVVVAWNMSEHGHFRRTLRSAPRGDKLVLLLTFGLTVFVDLTLAIEVGMVVAAFSFMYRMAGMVEVSAGVQLIEDDNGEETNSDADAAQREQLPPGVEVYQIRGPLFFGAANRVDQLLDQLFTRPRVFILRMRLVPLVDASGVHSLATLAERCKRQGIVLVISGLQPQPLAVARRMGLSERPGELHFAPDFPAALRLAATLSGDDLVRDIAGV